MDVRWFICVYCIYDKGSMERVYQSVNWDVRNARVYVYTWRDVAAMSVIPCSQIYMRNSATVQFRHLCIAIVSTLCIWVTWKKLLPRETPSNSTHPMEYQLYFCANPNRDRYKSSSPTKIYFPYKHAEASFAVGLFLRFRSFHLIIVLCSVRSYVTFTSLQNNNDSSLWIASRQNSGFSFVPV